MPNPYRGSLTDDIWGEEITLRPSFDALCELEDLLGKDVRSIHIQLVNEQYSIKTIAAVIWSGLMGEHLINGTQKPNFRIVGQKIQTAGLVNAVPLAINYLTYALTPAERIEELNKKMEKGDDEEKKSLSSGGDSQES